MPRRKKQSPLRLAIGLGMLTAAIISTLLFTDNYYQKTTTVPPPLGACYIDTVDKCQPRVAQSCPLPGDHRLGGKCDVWLDDACPRPDACQAKVVSATATATGTCGDREKLIDQCIAEAHNKTAKLCAQKAGPNCGAKQKGACAKSEPPADQTPAPSPSVACSIECTVISICVIPSSTAPTSSPI